MPAPERRRRRRKGSRAGACYGFVHSCAIYRLLRTKRRRRERQASSKMGRRIHSSVWTCVCIPGLDGLFLSVSTDEIWYLRVLAGVRVDRIAICLSVLSIHVSISLSLSLSLSLLVHLYASASLLLCAVQVYRLKGADQAATTPATIPEQLALLPAVTVTSISTTPPAAGSAGNARPPLLEGLRNNLFCLGGLRRI